MGQFLLVGSACISLVRHPLSPAYAPAIYLGNTRSGSFIKSSGCLSQDVWYSDTSATQHFTPSLSNFGHFEPMKNPESAHLGDGSSQPIHHIGSSKMISKPSNSALILKNMFHTPNISMSLNFVHKYSLYNNCYFIFYPFYFLVNDQASHVPLLYGEHDSHLY